MPANQIEIIPVAELLSIRWFAANQAQTRDPATLLIDRNDWLDIAEIAQIINQFSQLRGRRDIATKQNESAGLDAPEQFCCLKIEFFTRDTGHDQLTKGIGFHHFEGRRSAFNFQCSTSNRSSFS